MPTVFRFKNHTRQCLYLQEAPIVRQAALEAALPCPPWRLMDSIGCYIPTYLYKYISCSASQVSVSSKLSSSLGWLAQWLGVVTFWDMSDLLG